MRSPQSLLVPLLALVVIGLALVVRSSVDHGAHSGGGAGRRCFRSRRRALAAGLVVFTAGMVLDRAVPGARRVAVLQPGDAGGGRGRGRCRRLHLAARGSPVRSWSTAPSRWPAHPRCVAWVWFCCAFSWSRRCSGRLPPSRSGPAAAWLGQTARHLDDLPTVILDTKERLFLIRPGRQGDSPGTHDGRADVPLSLPESPAAHPWEGSDVPGATTPGRRATPCWSFHWTTRFG